MLGFIINVYQTAKKMDRKISDVNKEIVNGLMKKGYKSDKKIVVNPADHVHCIFGNYETKEVWAGDYSKFIYNNAVQECFEEIDLLEYKLTFKKIKEN